MSSLDWCWVRVHDVHRLRNEDVEEGGSKIRLDSCRVQTVHRIAGGMAERVVGSATRALVT